MQSENTAVPDSFHESLWIPIRKVENPTHLQDVRDLELPNEDKKVLSRMLAFVLDEGGPDTLHPAQQAFLQKRAVMRNIVGLNERFCSAHERQLMRAFLSLDCSKGYNMLG